MTDQYMIRITRKELTEFLGKDNVVDRTDLLGQPNSSTDKHVHHLNLKTI